MQRQEGAIKNVLFVCVGNAGRSQMAEAFFNHLAGGKARAISAGTKPVSEVSPIVIQAMQEVGIDISGNRPKKLTPEMLGQANKVIAMGCGAENVCLATWVETEDWELEDPKSQSIEKIREIRDQIKANVEKLLKETGP